MSLAFSISLGNLIYHTLIDVIVVISNVYWKIHVVIEAVFYPIARIDICGDLY